jgi:hypothetical protein
MAKPEFLHLVAEGIPAHHVLGILHAIGRIEPVLNTFDPLAIGPLHDVDSGAQARISWWEMVGNQPMTDARRRWFSELLLWKRVRDERLPIVLWHGPVTDDRLMVLRACSLLRNHPEPLFEVALSSKEERSKILGRWSEASTETSEAIWAKRTQILEVTERAKQWEALRDKPGEWIRELQGGEVAHHSIDWYDKPLIQACNGDWTRTFQASKQLEGSHFEPPRFLIAWRIRELVAAGQLETRGHVDIEGLPAEIRPARL